MVLTFVHRTLELQEDVFLFIFFPSRGGVAWYAFLVMSSLFNISNIHCEQVNQVKFYIQGRHSRVFIFCVTRVVNCSCAEIIFVDYVSRNKKNTGCKRRQKKAYALLHQMANRVLLIWKRVDEHFISGCFLWDNSSLWRFSLQYLETIALL